MANTKRKEKTITLGSGDMYIKEYSADEVEGFITNPATICTPENIMAGISGGATLKYSAEWYTAKDDSGKYQKTIITSETATISTGAVAWTSELFTQLTSTARVADEGTESGKRVVKIGGMDNFSGKSYLLCFHHTDKVDGDVWVIVRAQNQGDIELAFQKDSESNISCEFTCLSQDDEGTLVTYIEEVGTV